MENAEAVSNNPSNHQESGGQGKSMDFMDYMVQLMLTLLVSMMVLGVYHYYYGNQQHNIAVVDINELVELKQLVVSANALTMKKTDKTSQELYDQITAFTKQLESEITALQDECECMLLVRPAVIKGKTTIDYTDVLKQHLSLDGLNKDELIKQIASAGGNDPGQKFGEK